MWPRPVRLYLSQAIHIIFWGAGKERYALADAEIGIVDETLRKEVEACDLVQVSTAQYVIWSGVLNYPQGFQVMLDVQ